MSAVSKKVFDLAKEQVLLQNSSTYHSLAEDIAQEAAIRFLKSVHKKKLHIFSDSQLYVWTRKVTYRLLLDEHRKQTTSFRSNIELVGTLSDLVSIDLRSEEFSSNLDIGISDTTYKIMNDFVDSLPLRQKQVFWCALNNPDYKPKQIRQQLGMSESSMKSNYFDLRQSALAFDLERKLYE